MKHHLSLVYKKGAAEVGTCQNCHNRNYYFYYTSVPATEIMENKSEHRWRSMGSSSSSRGSSTRRRRSSSSSSSSSSSGWTWTNKRHVEFLNFMEASFVRTMLKNTLSRPPPPPLDRYLPDASDSTLDLDTQPTKPARRHSTSDILGSTRIRTDKRIGRLLYQPCNISPEDLVVPQFENRRADDDDEKDHQLDVTPPT